MVPGAKNKFGAPMFAPKVFRKQMYSIEESTCDIVGTFLRPAVIRCPGNCAALVPLVTPLADQHQILAGEVKNSAKAKLLSFNRADFFCMTYRYRKMTPLNGASAVGVFAWVF